MPGASPPVFLAFDAGATSTRAVAVDEAGTVLWRGAAPGASVSRLGVEGAAGIVNGLWRKAVEEAGSDVVGTLPAMRIVQRR
jgi:N-acetylglucosamine kinase-like BadF-type ATPase